MFGFGEMAAINAVIGGLKAVNELVAQAKEAGNSAASFGSIIGRFTEIDGQIREIEERGLKRPMTVKESMQISVAKRQCQTAMTNIRDAMLMTGNMATFKEMMDRVEDSRAQFEAQLAKKKRAAQARRKFMKDIFTYASIGIVCMALCVGSVYLYVQVGR